MWDLTWLLCRLSVFPYPSISSYGVLTTDYKDDLINDLEKSLENGKYEHNHQLPSADWLRYLLGTKSRMIWLTRAPLKERIVGGA